MDTRPPFTLEKRVLSALHKVCFHGDLTVETALALKGTPFAQWPKEAWEWLGAVRKPKIYAHSLRKEGVAPRLRYQGKIVSPVKVFWEFYTGAPAPRYLHHINIRDMSSGTFVDVNPANFVIPAPSKKPAKPKAEATFVAYFVQLGSYPSSYEDMVAKLEVAGFDLDGISYEVLQQTYKEVS